jgi:hypothetical protein
MAAGSLRRVVPAVALGALACASGALAVAGDEAGERGKGTVSVQLELLSTSQRHILDAGRLKISAEADAAATLRLRGLARLAGAKPSRVARTRDATLEAGEPRKLKLPLTAKGRERISGCAAQRLVIKERVSEARDALGGGDDAHGRITEDLVVDTPGCATGGQPGGDGAGAGGGSEGPGGAEPSLTERCDPLDPSVCLYPWPNDYFTVADSSTPTGRRLNLNLLSMPRSRQGVPILPEPYNRSDGFSPGNMIVTKVPGLDNQEAFENTGAVPITEIEASFDPNQPIVVINADTGERQLIWSEIDANPADPDDRALIIRPAENFEEGQRYIVALRNLEDSNGDPIAAQDTFKIYRDDLPTDDPAIEARRAHMEEIFDTLSDAGIQRDDLYLAWDFTVASEQNLSERALHIRNDAFAQLGDTNLLDLQIPPASAAPQFSVDSVTDYTALEDSRIARKVEGTFMVPCYLNAPGCPTGSRFILPPDSNIPQRIPGNTMSANFTCIIPRIAKDGLDPSAARPSLYGHGLLGSASEVEGGNVKAMAQEHNFVFCATDWAGFATQDAPNILATLQDLNNFPSFVDRTQQGFLNFLYLGRLMTHPDGFASNAAFQAGVPPEPVLDTTRLFYDGNSQGGILGGALTALAPDFNRAVLGVPGMNYSTLLRRSSDFHPYAEGEFTGVVCDELPEPFQTICETAPGDTPFGLYDNYPNELERPLILSLIQLQWDRAEADGYAHHMTSDPLPDTPPHNVLMHVAFGDHQVSMWSAEVEARTIGAYTNWPALDPGRHPDDDPGDPSDPLYGIPHIASYPFGGSAIIYWDSGSGVVAPPPTTNTPPGPAQGQDPHSHPRNTVAAREQKSEFLRVGGAIVDVCGGLPCHTDAYMP